MFDTAPGWPGVDPAPAPDDRPPPPASLPSPGVRALLAWRPGTGFGVGAPPLHAWPPPGGG